MKTNGCGIRLLRLGIFSVLYAVTAFFSPLFADQASISALAAPAGMIGLTDEELSHTQGQALFSLSYLAPGDPTNFYSVSNGNIGFYTLGIEAEISLNANIRNLQLGCGGVNGANGCDVDIQGFSLGCIANDSGVCVSLPTSTTGNATNNPSPHTTSASTVSDSLSVQKQMKDFVLSNPFYQFAIRNPNSAATREVVGIRIGAANAKGPMSFNDISSFSGYLSGKANITMQGKNDIAFTNNSDWYVGDGKGTTGTLGLADWNVALGIYASKLRADIDGDISREWAVARSGNRFSQALILNTDLDQVVNDVVDLIPQYSLEHSAGSGFLNFIIGTVYPALKTSVKQKVQDQLAAGLGLSGRAELPGYDIPYNLSNVGSLDIDSPAFGISLQSQSLYYPGYFEYNANGTQSTTRASMPRGWAMYLPSAFTLNISQPLDVFTANILGGAAAQGNIIGLPAPYRNCWGTLTFC